MTRGKWVALALLVLCVALLATGGWKHVVYRESSTILLRDQYAPNPMQIRGWVRRSSLLPAPPFLLEDERCSVCRWLDYGVRHGVGSCRDVCTLSLTVEVE